MRVLGLLLAVVLVGCSGGGGGEPEAADEGGFRKTPEQHAMPKTLLATKRTPIEKASKPVIDFHFHGGGLKTAEDYQKLVGVMDEVGVAMISNMDGGSRERLDKALELNAQFADRFITFARVDWEGVNEPGWSEKATAELERCFRAGAQGLKISKRLGLTLQNADGSYIQCDDPRLDSIWELCARMQKPVMMHLSDAVARFHPIGPENERYESGMWRSTPDGNYYGTDIPNHETIFEHRARMLDKHPETTYVMAHVASMGWDLGRVEKLLDERPNVHVEISARLQELGRQPYATRKFILKYQDRVLFGSDGDPPREADDFWRPHWRFLETDDEYFDHPAQMLSPLGAPLQGRWKIYGIFLPEDVLRKVYYENALRLLPGAREAMERHLRAAGN